MKCVGTEKITGRKHVTLEHISGDNAILTRKYLRIKCPLTISPLPRESRDVSLRAALKINFPSAKTLIDLLPYCQVKLPYPLHLGEKQVIQGKCYGVATLYTVRIDTRRSFDRHDYTHSIELAVLHIHLDVYCLFCLFYWRISTDISCRNHGVSIYSKRGNS